MMSPVPVDIDESDFFLLLLKDDTRFIAAIQLLKLKSKITKNTGERTFL